MQDDARNKPDPQRGRRKRVTEVPKKHRVGEKN